MGLVVGKSAQNVLHKTYNPPHPVSPLATYPTLFRISPPTRPCFASRHLPHPMSPLANNPAQCHPSPPTPPNVTPCHQPHPMSRRAASFQTALPHPLQRECEAPATTPFPFEALPCSALSHPPALIGQPLGL